MAEELLHFYRQGVIPDDKIEELKQQFGLSKLRAEVCFNIETEDPLDPDDLAKLKWLISETFEQKKFSDKSFFPPGSTVEVGTNNNFTTAWSTNAVSICHACGIDNVTRIEISRRYFLPDGQEVDPAFVAAVHDRMTECPYPEILKTFAIDKKTEPVKVIPLIERGIKALEDANIEIGLGMDDQDFAYYQELFVETLGRNPTDVELFQLGQANSDHSRHHVFKGKFVIDGKKMPYTLMDLIRAPFEKRPGNSVIAFYDNSSGVKGFDVWTVVPLWPGKASPMGRQRFTYHILYTSETHNYPCAIASISGAETGTGGRERDNTAAGRGSSMVAGAVGFCVGALRIPGYDLPWEHPEWPLPSNLTPPLQILLEESFGAFDYGNKIGEPVIAGFARSNEFDFVGERRAWLKPIMFTGGISTIIHEHVKKNEPQKGELVIILGGPNYEIGMGGGSGSSQLLGSQKADLDFDAVQRGDAEMQRKDINVIRSCYEMGKSNPIQSIHDLGAGGNCNAIPEGIDPAGALINLKDLPLGDPTLSTRQIWGNESQERYFITIKVEDLEKFESICQREKCPFAVVGEIIGDGYMKLYDEKDNTYPVNLALEHLFGRFPQKTYKFKRRQRKLESVKLPKDLTIGEALDRVLCLLAVGSKHWSTVKVDRSVTGLIAQQPNIGPLQKPLADFGLIATSHLETTGAALAIGEQPIKGSVSPQAMARMSTAEALTNLVWVAVKDWQDIRFAANWMAAARVDDEGARLYDAAEALSNFFLELKGPVIDGGKDSSSMAAKVPFGNGQSETVKAPLTLVMSAYAPVPDITKKVTPDIKKPGQSKLMFIDLVQGHQRLGGSALAQVFEQIGTQTPDVEDSNLLKNAFEAVQKLISRDLILAGHDRSDGGLITCLLEMAFAGNCGLELDFREDPEEDWFKYFFNEELGLVIEYLPENENKIRGVLRRYGLTGCCYSLGWTLDSQEIIFANYGKEIFSADMIDLCQKWEETSYQLEKLQANPRCIEEERRSNVVRVKPSYHLTFKSQSMALTSGQNKPKVAILREEGSNGEREMASAFYAVGFEPWDVTMTDITSGRITLDQFQGAVFVGGFSYSDVLDAAKGWAGVIRFNAKAVHEFRKFYERSDTFSLGVCNGCQVMALLGWVPWAGIEMRKQPRFICNISRRFESRYPTVKILESPAIMLKDMAGSILPAITAHGEGRFHAPDGEIFEQIIEQNLAPIRFVDDKGELTEVYPFNPNGSPKGITALCSPDGRHLAFMEHPERLFLLWQIAAHYLPREWQKLPASPWLKLFQNAYDWCME